MRIAILILSAIITFSAFAGGSTKLGVIDHIYVNNTWTMVDVTGVSDNPDGCNSTAYYAVVPSDANYQTIHSTLMAAQLAGKKVKFYVSGCSGQGNKYPKITSVWMYN
jgi:hypothetical protein